jgi:hypothetical protein
MGCAVEPVLASHVIGHWLLYGTELGPSSKGHHSIPYDLSSKVKVKEKSVLCPIKNISKFLMFRNIVLGPFLINAA